MLKYLAFDFTGLKTKQEPCEKRKPRVFKILFILFYFIQKRFTECAPNVLLVLFSVQIFTNLYNTYLRQI